MNVCHVVPSLHPEAGGPSRTVVQLSDALANIPDISVQLVTQGRRNEPQVPSQNTNVIRQVGRSRWPLVGSMGLSGAQGLHHVLECSSPALIHIHGIWHPLSHWAMRACKKRGIPAVMHPRGMLEPWALAWRSRKKNLALRAYQRSDLESAKVLFATADQEADGFRRLGLRQPIAVIPNGVDFGLATLSADDLSANTPGKLRKALFLSRIHPVKGLLNLLEAWATLDYQDWILQLAGPDEGGHLAEVRQRIYGLGLQDHVEVLGSIDDADKSALYEAADIFVLSSFSENFGVVVAEALSYGIPVIATRGAPWQGLEEHRCGWWVEPTVEGLRLALRDALSKQPSELQEMGHRGKVYARHFDWTHIAQQTLDVYRWILGEGHRPGCVYLD